MKISNKTQVLYISYDGMTDPLGQSQVIPYLEGLSKEGFEIFLLSFEKRDKFLQNKEKIGCILKNSNIKWIPTFYNNKIPILSTVYDIFKGYQIAKKIVRKENIKIVHGRGHSAANYIAHKISANFSLKYIFDMRGFWAQERVDGGLWNLKNPLYYFVFKFFIYKEKKYILDSNKIISLTENAKVHLNNLHGIGKKIIVIPCAADLNHFVKANKNKIEEKKKELLLLDKYIFLISGNLKTWYLTDEMMTFFAFAKKTIHNAHLLIVSLENKSEIEEILRKANVNKSDYSIISSSREDMPLYYSISDASIFFIKPAPSKIASSPTKHGELLSCNIPVICNGGYGDIEKIMDERETGVLIKDFTNNEFKFAINKLLSTDYKKNHFDFVANKYYSLEDGIQKYKNVYEELKN